MRNRPRSDRPLLVLVIALLCLSVSGCEDSVFDVEDFGEIRFDLDLSGTPAEDSDPFRIDWRHTEIDDATGGEPFTPEFLPRTISNVPAGRVEVELSEAPPNCSVDDSTRVIDVPVDATADVSFTVTCE